MARWAIARRRTLKGAVRTRTARRTRVEHDLPTVGVCVACATPPVEKSTAQRHVCGATTRLRRSDSDRLLEGENVHLSTETGQARTPVFRAFLCTQVLAWGETPGDRDIGREPSGACRVSPAFRDRGRPTWRTSGLVPAAGATPGSVPPRGTPPRCRHAAHRFGLATRHTASVSPR